MEEWLIKRRRVVALGMGVVNCLLEGSQIGGMNDGQVDEVRLQFVKAARPLMRMTSGRGSTPGIDGDHAEEGWR